MLGIEAIYLLLDYISDEVNINVSQHLTSKGSNPEGPKIILIFFCTLFWLAAASLQEFGLELLLFGLEASASSLLAHGFPGVAPGVARFLVDCESV